jgi:uncharacterized protein YjbI with pentapeptide repeats
LCIRDKICQTTKVKMTKKSVTLQTIFEDKEALLTFAKVFNISTADFKNEEANIYLNERFPFDKIKQVKSLFQLRILKGWLFCNFWDIQVEPLDKLYLNDLNLDGLGFIEMDLKDADFNNSSLVRAYFRSTNLENVNFQNANLTNAFLMRANLKNVNFEGANLNKIQDKAAIWDDL